MNLFAEAGGEKRNFFLLTLGIVTAYARAVKRFLRTVRSFRTGRRAWLQTAYTFGMSTIDAAAVIGLTRELVRIPSENPGGSETRVQAWLRGRFQAAGIETDTVLTQEGRETLLARIPGASDSPGLLLTGHADVVPVSREEQPDWVVDPYGGVIRDGRLYGRGSTDMKGGLAAGALAFCSLAARRHPPSANVLFISTADEEDRMTGARSILHHPWLEGVSHVLVMEPTDLRLASRGNGRTFGIITCYGQKAHGAIPAAARNAILLMHDVVATLMAADPAKTLGAPGSFWQPISIEAGVEPGIVPDRCRMTLDARLTYPAKPSDVWQYAAELLADAPVRIEPLDLRRPWQAENGDRLAALLETGLSAIGESADHVTFPGSTDGNIFLERGIQPLICGPGTLALAHRANESVSVHALEQAAALYLDVLEGWSAGR